MDELMQKAREVKCLISDVDGVLTDGSLYIDETGKELKAFQVQDGMGFKLLMAAGIQVAVITTSRSALIDHRMKQLGIEIYYTGQVDKRGAYQKIKTDLRLDDNQFAYVGDDLPDLSIIKQVGMGVAVANAVPQVKEFSAWQTEKTGGTGAVRELCDLILTAQNKMDLALQRYLQ